MKYSSETARKLARQIRDRFGLKIAQATEGTSVPPKFVAGLIGVEAGKDRNGQIKEEATRFEPGVFAKLQQVRDGQRKSWSGIKTAHIRDSVDLALRALATSYGLTQVMGWHCINNLDCSVKDLRDPEKHLGYAVKLLDLNAADGDFERKEYVGEFKEWNSGSESGRTHDPDYVHNAGAVMDAYAELPLPERIDVRYSGEVGSDGNLIPSSVVVTDKPEPKKPEPSVTTVPGKPPVIEVQPRGTSITTKIAAGASAVAPVIAATGLKIGGVEFKTGGLIAIAAVIIVGMVLGAWIYNESQKRRSEELRSSMNNLASPDRLNVVAGDTKA